MEQATDFKAVQEGSGAMSCAESEHVPDLIERNAASVVVLRETVHGAAAVLKQLQERAKCAEPVERAVIGGSQ